FLKNFVKAPRLDTRRGCLGVSVHWVATPQDFFAAFHQGANEWRQIFLDVLDAEPVDEGQTARFIFGVQSVRQPQCFLWRNGRTEFDRDWVGDAAEEFDMRAVERSGAIANPRKMRRKIIPPGAVRDLPGLSLLIMKV